MTAEAKRPNILISLALLLVIVLVGAYVSNLPLLIAKAGVATLLFFLYGYCAVRIVSSLQIESSAARKAVGLILGVATVYLTWALRLPVFSGWQVAFTLDPSLLYQGIMERASAIEISKGFGHGTTTEGPSWLMRGTYLVEAVAFAGVMVLCAWLSAPDKEGTQEVAAETPPAPTEAP